MHGLSSDTPPPPPPHSSIHVHTMLLKKLFTTRMLQPTQTASGRTIKRRVSMCDFNDLYVVSILCYECSHMSYSCRCTSFSSLDPDSHTRRQTRMHMHTQTHTHTCTLTHAYTHTYMHTHTHICNHIHTHSQQCKTSTTRMSLTYSTL